MHRFLFVSGLVLSAALIAPLAVKADDDHYRERRYYDREHHDYHVWNDHEDRAYRVYLGERHQEYREWHKVNRSHQVEYYRWRHEHPDHTLFKVEIR